MHKTNIDPGNHHTFNRPSGAGSELLPIPIIRLLFSLTSMHRWLHNRLFMNNRGGCQAQSKIRDLNTAIQILKDGQNLLPMLRSGFTKPSDT